MTKLEEAVQRTFDLQIPCTCSRPAFCNRYHGLPELPAAAINPERQKLYDKYDELWAKHPAHPNAEGCPQCATQSAIFRELVRI